MTVAELKKELEGLPDIMEVLIVDNKGIKQLEVVSKGMASTFASPVKKEVLFIIPKFK